MLLHILGLCINHVYVRLIAKRIEVDSLSALTTKYVTVIGEEELEVVCFLGLDRERTV